MPAKNPTNSPIRHAVARTTGSTTHTSRQADGSWLSICINHNSTASAPNRSKAWTTGSHPEAWCPACKAIAAGKKPKITEGRLDLPTTKKTPAKKAAPKKPTAPKPTPEPTPESAA